MKGWAISAIFLNGPKLCSLKVEFCVEREHLHSCELECQFASLEECDSGDFGCSLLRIEMAEDGRQLRTPASQGP